MRTDAEAQNKVTQMIRRDGFTTVVDRLEVNRGLVYRVWKFGLYSPTVRRALKMPINLVPAPPCPDCGKVHTVPWCVQERGAPVPETEKEIVYVEVQPEPKPKRKQTRTRHRVSLEVDTPAEAAALRALLARYGTRRRIARALVTGELKIVENGE